MEISQEELTRLGETQRVELKQSLSERREGLEALCGMLNTDGAVGTVYFGVTPQGIAIGIEPGNLDTAQRTLAQHIEQKFDPRIIPSINVVTCEGKRLIHLEAQRPRGVPYHEYDGRAFIREGTRTRQLSVAEKQQLAKGRNRDQHNGPWQCDRCGMIVGALYGLVLSDQGVAKTYNCDCGGEFWPMP